MGEGRKIDGHAEWVPKRSRLPFLMHGFLIAFFVRMCYTITYTNHNKRR